MAFSIQYDPNQTNQIITILKNEFQQITDIFKMIVSKKNTCENKITNLKETYNELVKKNSNRVFLFCLDSLFFQYKLLNLEFENYNKKIGRAHV